MIHFNSGEASLRAKHFLYLGRRYSGSYLSAHVLLFLLNELGKRDKMRGLPSIFSPFNEFHKFNNTGARMLASIKITLKSYFCRKNFIILS